MPIKKNEKCTKAFLLFTFDLFASVVGSVIAYTTHDLNWAWYSGSAFFIGIYGMLSLTEETT